MKVLTKSTPFQCTPYMKIKSFFVSFNSITILILKGTIHARKITLLHSDFLIISQIVLDTGKVVL